MTIKEISTKFKVSKYDNRYDISDLSETSCNRFVHRYLCSLTKNKTGFSIIGQSEVYYNLDKLSTAIYHYADSLPYPSSYYNPSLREGVLLMYVVDDFMINLGFKRSGNDGYVLNTKTVYGGEIKTTISFGEFVSYDYKKPLSETLYISVWNTDMSRVKILCKRTPEDVINGINSLLKPLFLTNGMKFIELSDKLTFTNLDDMIHEELNSNTLSFKSVLYKEELKKKLLEIVDKLN